MTISHYLSLQERITLHFQQHEKQLAVLMLISLDDISIENIHFVDFISEFAPTSNGVSQNIQQLSKLSYAQLDTMQQFLKYIQRQCPLCFHQNVKAGIQTIQSLLQNSTRVS